MSGMSAVTDPRTGEQTPVSACRSCNAPIYWGVTANGKRNPYDIVDGEATTASHFGTCKDASTWSKKGAKA